MAETIPRIRVTDPNLATFSGPSTPAGPLTPSEQPAEDVHSPTRSIPSILHHRTKSSTDTAKSSTWRSFVPGAGQQQQQPPSPRQQSSQQPAQLGQQQTLDAPSERPMSAKSMDPLSQAIFTRTGNAPSPSRSREPPEPPTSHSAAPLPVTHEDRRAGDSPSPDPSKTHSRDRKSGAGFFSRIIGNKKKEDGDNSNEGSSDPGDERLEGGEAEAFYQPIDNMGFSPKHPQPPPYIKVRSKYKKEREFNRVFFAQRLAGSDTPLIRRPESVMNGKTARRRSLTAGNAVWAMAVSRDGHYLAAAGQDKVVRVWQILSNPQERREFEKGEEANMGAPGQVHLSAPVFKQDPIRTYEGHEGPILDLSWSKNNFLLSSSMDKSVRLWHVSRNECLCAFNHSDFVTSIQFHPKDDRFFLAGSLDSRLRLWSIPDKSVAYSNQLSEMITAVAFTPDGKTAIAGCLNGLCQFHETEGLRYTTQIHVRSRTGKNAKGSKITGIQAVNVGSGRGSSRDVKLLITSNDSRIRLYNLRDKSLEMKFKGNENVSSQIRAQLTDDARYVVCGSEDNKVYIWSTEPSDTEKKDKWPLETFEAHNASVTACFFAPMRSRVLLSQSEDPLFDICNPPPVTLLSRSEVTEPKDSASPSETGTPTSPVAASGRNTSPPAAPSAAYLSRSIHPNGNIILTADDTGAIKVFRQDCAWLQRMRADLNSETSSIKRASSAFLKRSNSMMTTRSSTSATGLVRQGSTASTNNSGSRDRILSWRQSIGGTSTHSLENASVRSPSINSTSSPVLPQNRTPARNAGHRISLNIMRQHFGRNNASQSPGAENMSTSAPTGTGTASPTASSERSSVREKPSANGLAVLGSGGSGSPSAAGAPLSTITSAAERETSPHSQQPRIVEPEQERGKHINGLRSPRTELRRVASDAYWNEEAWKDEIQQQLSAPRRDLSAHSDRTSSRNSTASTNSRGKHNALGVPTRPGLEKQLSGWSAMTLQESRRGSVETGQ